MFSKVIWMYLFRALNDFDMECISKYQLIYSNLFRSYLDCDCKILGPAKLLKVKDDHRFRLVLMGKDKIKMIDSIHHALDMMKGNRLVANIKVDVNG